MRIIAGIARGRRLEAPQGVATRPTSDRVREAMFSAIEARLDLAGAEVLDLFAGSGALGLEAVSRGAARVVFVDHSAACERAILRNGASIGCEDAINVLRMDALAALALLMGQGRSFDLVLADPPYADPVGELLDALGRSGLLAAGGLLVIEHAKQRAVGACGDLRLLHARRYGDTMVSFLAHARAHAKADAHAEGCVHAEADADADAHAHAHAVADAQTEAGAHAEADADADAACDAHAQGDAGCDADAQGDAGCDADAQGDSHAHAHADCDGNSDP